jgi:glycosyltransferase involved in cell wall biosynthesis
MIRICSSLSEHYDVLLVGRKKTDLPLKPQLFCQKRFVFLFKKGPLFYVEYNVRLFFFLLFARFDVVHSVDLDTLPAGYLASIFRRKKLVYDAHEYFTEVPELIHRPRIQNIWLKIERKILPNLEFAITVGEAIAKEYERKYNLEFTVVRNCPLLQEISISDTLGKYLIYQGALNKGRGLEALIEAMQNIPMPLKIAGTGDIDHELQVLVQKFGVEKKFEFLGLIEPKELLSLTQKAFAGINVSENLGLSYYYSLNNKYFDYVHAGLPAITNPFPEYVALNQQFECCVYANAKASEIADAVNLLLNDASLYQRLKKNCVIAREELNWQSEQNRLFDLYERVTQ